MLDEKTEAMDFAVDVTEKEYVRAVLFASRRIGALRSAPFILAVGLLLLTVGLCAFSWFPSSLLLPVFLCVSGPLLVLLFYLAEPAAVRRSAGRDYATFARMMKDSRILLEPDQAQTTTACMTLTDPYALMACLIETPDLLIFVKDRERLLILPKRCLPAGEKEKTLEFLRLVFIRKRRVMRAWWY